MKIKKFLNAKINLSKFHFIPREETKFWLKKALKELKNENKKLKVLDIFSGTGCIGIAILRACPELCRRVDFGDIDDRALEQIKMNLKINKINPNRVKIIKTNIFSNIKGKYDLILANPPYVAKERLNEVQLLVRKFEPKGAWYGGEKGIFFVSKFLKLAENFLKKSGKIYLEFDPQQGKEIKKILKGKNYKYQFFKDQFGKLRYAEIWIKNNKIKPR